MSTPPAAPTKPLPPAPDLHESVAGEEDPGASIDAPDKSDVPPKDRPQAEEAHPPVD